MAKLRYTDTARADLADIMIYIASESRSVRLANNFRRHIQEKCRRLARLPGTMGRPRPELGSDMRSIAFKGYVIFFRYVGNVLEVVNVLEGHRDIDAYYRDDEA